MAHAQECVRSEDFRQVHCVHRRKHVAELFRQTESTKREGFKVTGHTAERFTYVLRYGDQRLAQIPALICGKCRDYERLDCATILINK